MNVTRGILAAFIGSVLAGVFLLAYRASKQTEKSIPASLVDVPGEARNVYVKVKGRATDAVNRRRGTSETAEGEAPSETAEGEATEWAETGVAEVDL